MRLRNHWNKSIDCLKPNNSAIVKKIHDNPDKTILLGDPMTSPELFMTKGIVIE